MGYKYGIWLVYDKHEFSTAHIGHITITCYMEKDEATCLYHELVDIFGKYHEVYIECTHPVKFVTNFYDDDNNDLYAWGYEGHILENGLMTNLWSNIEDVTKKYKCNFACVPHTSIFYSHAKYALLLEKMPENKIVKCSMELVDITSDDPLEWNIMDISC